MVIKARIAYLGRNFLGFERQKEGRTVQGTIEKTLSDYFGTEILVQGAGRTDAGVNASGQVIAFSSPRESMDFERERRAIDRRLPSDLSLLSLEEAPAGFHPRKSAKCKIYAYRFSFGERDVFQPAVTFLDREEKFNPSLFEKTLSLFVGRHDFASFTSKDADARGFVRTIESIDVANKGKETSVVFKGDGFMTYQIRFIVGAAFKAAYGELSIDEVQKRIDAPKRSILSYKAPAEGLTLVYVGYE